MREGLILSKIKESYGGLPRSIYILFIARIINRIGGFVYAFLTIYMRTKLGMSESEIGYFIMIQGALSMASPFVGGHIADKKGRKFIYILAPSISAALFMACGIFTDTNPEIVPILIIIASMLNNLVGPINSAMVADITKTPEERRKAYSLLYLGINLGVAIGPIIGGFLLANYTKWFFFGDGITTFLSVILVAIFVKETMLSHDEMKLFEGNEKMESGSTLRVLFKKPVLVVFTVFSMLSATVYAQSSFGFSLHLADVFGDELGPKYLGMLMSFNAIVVIIFTMFITEFLKNKKEINNIAIASLLNAIGFGMLAFVGGQLPLYFLSVLIWTWGEIIMVTNNSVFIMSHTPVNYRGRFNAIISFITGVGFVTSPKIMSYFIEGYGYQVAWQVVGAAALISTIGFILTGKIDSRRNDNKADSRKRA
jgi:MFS family permease